jgi:4'-phosphopantetheinyl transferase
MMANEPGLARPDPASTYDVPRLADGEIHVWRLDLGLLSGLEPRLAGVLSAEEERRSGRFVHERDRAFYIAGRSALRHLLSGYVGVPPEEVPLRIGAHGKPFLDGELRLHFNLSHSAGLALLAVTEVSPVGVDVERVGPIPELEAIAARFFTAGEAREIRMARATEQRRLFFNCWTRKEAYLKAVGGGLSIPLSSVELTVSGEPRLLAIAGDRSAAGQWSLRHLRPAPGYVGALAAPATGYRVRRLSWAGPGTGNTAPRAA